VECVSTPSGQSSGSQTKMIQLHTLESYVLSCCCKLIATPITIAHDIEIWCSEITRKYSRMKATFQPSRSWDTLLSHSHHARQPAVAQLFLLGKLVTEPHHQQSLDYYLAALPSLLYRQDIIGTIRWWNRTLLFLLSPPQIV
jgi:hypothetical protein